MTSRNAPGAVGPYSPAVVSEESKTVYVSGQVPLDPATGQLVEGDIAVQTRRVLESIRALLEASGSGMDRVLKTTVYMADLGQFGPMNEVYATFFPGVKPARATIEVSRLPKDARIEIDAIATLP
ncbi:MAG: Rid family detoxifying hydrolase [Candidatus Zixiibacteriota bacterium]